MDLGIIAKDPRNRFLAKIPKLKGICINLTILMRNIFLYGTGYNSKTPLGRVPNGPNGFTQGAMHY